MLHLTAGVVASRMVARDGDGGPLEPLARGRRLAIRALARGAVGCLVEPEAARVREERGRVRVWEHDCVVCRVDLFALFGFRSVA